MTVLLVDDQISILSGLISGINWEALGVTAIRTAGNAAQAKKILQQERVDVLLCDIEMPGENGLSLLRWARGRGMELVCVFLTSHADFLYAKEAISLGCFDYVLQPARYEDIQATVKKAISRVAAKQKDRELEYYGIYAKSHPGGVFQALFGSWITDGHLSVPRLRTTLSRFHKQLPEQCDCALIVGQLLRWRANPWPFEQWSYGLNNVFAELFGNAEMEAIPFTIDQSTLGWFVYARDQLFSQETLPLQILESVYLYITQYFPCDFALYLSSSLSVDQIEPQAGKLMQAKKDNVLQRSGIFQPDKDDFLGKEPPNASTVQMHRWEELLSEGNGQLLQQEVIRYLDECSASETFDYRFLHNVWLQFQQVVLNVTWDKQLFEKDILAALRQGETAQSLEDVRASVARTASFFQSGGTKRDQKTIVQLAVQYVDEHLDAPFTVGDIANALFINADHLSRLFKTEHGVPLKEYIVMRKMHTAQVFLRTTSLPVSIIASKVGYDNCSYFSQAYKKITGYTPSEERKK